MNSMLLNILLLLPQDGSKEIDVLFLLIPFQCRPLSSVGTPCSDKLMMALWGKLSAGNGRNGAVRERPPASQTRPALACNSNFCSSHTQGRAPASSSAQDPLWFLYKLMKVTGRILLLTDFPLFHQDIHMTRLKIMGVSFHEMQHFYCSLSCIFIFSCTP